MEEEHNEAIQKRNEKIFTIVGYVAVAFFSIFLIFSLLLIMFSVAQPFIFPEIVSVNVNPIYEEEWEYKMKENPELATYINDNRYNSKLTSFSLDSIEKRNKYYKELLSKLNSIKFIPKDNQEDLSFKLFKYQINSRVKSSIFNEEYMNIDHLENGPQIEIPNTMRDTRFSIEKDYTDFIERLSNLEIQINERIELLKLGVKAG